MQTFDCFQAKLNIFFWNIKCTNVFNFEYICILSEIRTGPGRVIYRLWIVDSCQTNPLIASTLLILLKKIKPLHLVLFIHEPLHLPF